MKQFFSTIIISIAVIFMLFYLLGYDYILTAVGKTLLRGETGPTTYDGKLFRSTSIAAGKPKYWVKDEQYNQIKISDELKNQLNSTNTTSFIIIKNGKLLHESYWNSTTEHTLTNSFSIAKTISVLLLGKAITEHKINNVKELFTNMYPEFAKDEHWKNLTLEDLASMQAGMKWDENNNNPLKDNTKAYYGNNLGFVFFKGFQEKPGTSFHYQSGATQLLGYALRKAVQMPLSFYLSDKLWKPLGMEQNASWNTDELKMEKAFCCVQSTPRDFAKLGQLILDNGKTQDSIQLISSDFIEQMRTPNAHSKGVYGMGLWLNYDSKIPHIFSTGYKGQYLIIIPEKNMVIVRTGNSKQEPKDTAGRPKAVEELVQLCVDIFS